jgi:hypothetical protein
MISNDDLIKIAKKEKIPLNDVFFKDFPSKVIQSGGYIINLQDGMLNRGGSHYVALYVPAKIKQLAYMDSFGFPPSQSTINWIKKSKYKSYPVYWNNKVIQSVDSGGCGIYSLYFIDFVSRFRDSVLMSDLIQKYADLFDEDTGKNLTLLKKLAPYYMNSKMA